MEIGIGGRSSNNNKENLMKKLMIVLMLLASIGVAQTPIDEEPEPIFGPEEYSYEAEIAWGSKASLVWDSVPITNTLISPQEPPDHFYGIIVLGGSREVFWSGYTPNHTEADPESIVIGIEVPDIPDGKWWGFFRVRFRPFPLVYPGYWSETSYWLAIIDLSAMPTIGPFRAKP